MSKYQTQISQSCPIQAWDEGTASRRIPVIVRSLALYSTTGVSDAVEVFGQTEAIGKDLKLTPREQPRFRGYWPNPALALRGATEFLLGRDVVQMYDEILRTFSQVTLPSVDANREPLTQEECKEFQRGISELLGILRGIHEEAIAAAAGKNIDVPLVSRRQVLPFLFLWRVWMPSMTVCHQRCDHIYRLAIQGNANAISQVRRLDPWSDFSDLPVIDENTIAPAGEGARTIRRWTFAKNAEWIKSLIAALLIEWSKLWVDIVTTIRVKPLKS